MDIVAQLRQGIRSYRATQQDNDLMQSAADTIEFLRTDVERLKQDRSDAHRVDADKIRVLENEITRLGESLNKCHEQMMRRTDGPVHGAELEDSLLVGGRYRAPECGGFQGFED